MTEYQLWYADELGNRFFSIDDYTSFEYSKTVGDVGVGIFKFPFDSVKTYQQPTAVDRRIVVLRSALGGLRQDYSGFMRQFKYATDSKGQTYTTITCFDNNDLLRRRIIAYYKNEAETSITDYADDMMKTVVTDNLVTNADYSGTPSPSRSISGDNFSVDVDLSAGPSLTKEFAWQNVLEVLQDIQADSKAQGNEVFFFIESVGENYMRFATRTSQPGSNRSQSAGANPIIFSTNLGNLYQPSLTYDYSDEVTFMYAGGRGQNDARIIQTASDSDRLKRSLFARIEGFVETGEELNAPTAAAASRELGLRRPRVTFESVLLSTESTPYGLPSGWNMGDTVTINYVGRQFDVIARSVHVKVDEKGKEQIHGRAEIE